MNLLKSWRNVTFLRRSIHSKRLVFSEFGDPPAAVKLEEVDVPDPGAGEVLVRWLGAPINPADINLIQGVYPVKRTLPCVGGNEGVGVVEKVGKDVNFLHIGDHVLPGKSEVGTWQEHGLCSADKVYVVDKRLPLEVAATMQVNPPTAFRMLEDFVELHPGDCVIQNGASSAVGRAVIQICRSRGIKTINLVRKRDDMNDIIEELKALGADLVITEEQLIKEYRKEVKNIPLALNCVGGRSTLFLANCLASGGKMVTYGGMSKHPLQIPTGPLIFKDIILRGFWMTRWYSKPEHRQERERMLSKLTDLALSGGLRAPIIQRRKLEEHKETLEEAMTVFGKKQMFCN